MCFVEWHVLNLILKVRGGSHAYGLNTESSDMDYRGVALPPVQWLVGFAPSDKAWTVEHKVGNEDVVVHALPKFCRLALGANPNMWDILFCRDADVVVETAFGTELRQLRKKFLSRRAYKPFTGYAYSQLVGMKNHNTRHGAHGPLIEKFGYDTKNAVHLIRLLRMGLEVLTTGEVHVYREHDREELLGIRGGAMSYTQVVAEAERMLKECELALPTSPLPEEPDAKSVEDWLMDVQAAHVWSEVIDVRSDNYAAY